MKTTEGSITTENERATTEDTLFTYSEEERQLNEINAANAKLIFSPEFVPFYFDVQKEYGFSYLTTLIYGFIRFYKVSSSTRFYFTNEQVAQIFECSESSASNSITDLEKAGLIETSRKVKANGGQVRFVTKVFRLLKNSESDYEKIKSRNRAPTMKKLRGNNNTLKENKKKFENSQGITLLEERFSTQRKKKSNKKDMWGRPKKQKPNGVKVNHKPLDRDQLVQIGVDLRVHFMDVKETHDQVMLRIKNGESEKYSINDVEAVTRMWVQNNINRGVYTVLQEEYQIEADVRSYSTENLARIEKMRKRMEEKGL